MDAVAELDAFYGLFAGSDHAYGTEQGGCVRRPEAERPQHWLREAIKSHLQRNTPIGVYPHYNSKAVAEPGYQTMCAWGCVDFDEGETESWVHAVNLQNVLNEFGIKGWIERSRSKGFHVWVFPKNHVPAATMRRALLAATSIADAPIKEINPKQEHLVPGADGSTPLGNYVRLPYPNNGPETRRVMVDMIGEPIRLETFLHQAQQLLASSNSLEQLAALMVVPTPPEPAPRPLEATTGRAAGNVGTYTVSVLPGLIHHMIQNGPMADQQDRSAWMWRMCRTMYEKNVPWADARQALAEADARWGKFGERPDGESVLDRMLAKAYGAR
jgi:hypothetical protein